MNLRSWERTESFPFHVLIPLLFLVLGVLAAMVVAAAPASAAGAGPSGEYIGIDALDVVGTVDAGPSSASTPAPATIITHGSRDVKNVALTFDMGGRLTPALSIMQWLITNKVHATIFVTGETGSTTTDGPQVLALIKAHPELFDLGNHSWDHPYFTDLTAAQIRDQLTRTEAALAPLAGQSTKPWFRPPYMSYNSAVAAAVGAAAWSYMVIQDFSTIDWKPVSDGGPTTTDIVNKVNSLAQNGSIIGMHLGGYNTFDALPGILQVLKAKGLQPVTLSEMFGLVPAPPTITSLSPPSGLTAGGTAVTITGANLTGATAVKFGTTAATGVTVTSATQITCTSPPGSGTVDVTVTTPGGTSAVTAGDTFTYTVPTLPAKPTNLAATAPSSSSMEVTWKDNASDELGYFILRWTGSTWEIAGVVGPNVTTFTDSDRSRNTIYVYIVGSYNLAGENWADDICYAATLGIVPAKVTNVTATVLSTTSIKVDWEDNSSDEWGFVVVRWDGSAFVNLGMIDPNVTTHTDSGLTAGHQYAYFIAAVNNSGGDWGDPVWVTTSP